MTRYVCVGGAVGLLYIGLSLILAHRFGLGRQLSSAAALTVTSLLSYFGHHAVTFGARGRHALHLPRYAVLIVAMYAVSYGIIAASTHWHIVPYAAAVAGVAIVCPAASYVCNRLVVFAVPGEARRRVA